MDENTNKPPIKVLIAEDEESIRMVFAEYLRMEGFVVEEAEDGEQAIKKAKMFNYDIMLLDIMMPKKTGIDVLQVIKKDPETKDKKVIVLTVLARDPIVKQAFALGADGYLVKDKLTPEDIKKYILRELEGPKMDISI